MSHNINGLIYEQSIHSVISEVGTKIKVVGDAPTAGFNAHDTDMKLDIMGQMIDLEIKADLNAQMGGTSFSYDMATGEFKPVKPIPEEDLNLILKEMSFYTSGMNTLIEEVRKSSPKSYNEKNGFPLATTKKTWERIREENYLLPLNAKVKRNTEFLHDHYSKKGVNYIQIGGAGLFYLKENPLSLPVPQLAGDMTLEIRPGRSGSTLREHRGDYHEFVSVGIRVQGRLKFKGKSPYTLDDPESLQQLEQML